MPPVSQVSMMEEQQRQSNMVRSAGASSAPHGSTEYFFMPFICLLRVRNDAWLDIVDSECKENPPVGWLTLPCQHVFALFFYKHAANMHDEHERKHHKGPNGDFHSLDSWCLCLSVEGCTSFNLKDGKCGNRQLLCPYNSRGIVSSIHLLFFIYFFYMEHPFGEHCNASKQLLTA